MCRMKSTNGNRLSSCPVQPPSVNLSSTSYPVRVTSKGMIIIYIYTCVITSSVLCFQPLPDHNHITNLWLDKVDKELKTLNQIATTLSWDDLTGQENTLPIGYQIGSLKNIWQNEKCNQSRYLYLRNEKQKRAINHLCRGPKYTDHQSRQMGGLLYELGRIYRSTKVCKEETCYKIEPDLDKLMQESRDPEVLLWGWKSWRNAVGPPSLQLYPSLIEVQNQAARSNGYKDISECWKEELETSNLDVLVESLFQEIWPMYQMLHALVRYKLSKYYGEKLVPKRGTMPAHLLGNMWAQSWENLFNIVKDSDFDLNNALLKRNYSVPDLVKLSESFYTSMGFKPMTKEFWEYSQIAPKGNKSISCHGTAANMYKKGDYRMLLCAEVCWEDLYVIHHEMGHIEYYMTYENQPTIFQDGPNSAFQEAIGDTIMIAVETPSHLKRLGINVGNNKKDFNMDLLLWQALKKIPHLVFGLIVDKWRWRIMSSQTKPANYNEFWWQLRKTYSGLHPPIERNESDFDLVSKFHVADNTPYIRYYLSGFLQFQFFEVLCEYETFGRANYKEVPFLNECDLYGSKIAGDYLRSMMSEGASEPWYKLLEYFSMGKYRSVSARPLLKYFSPLMKWIQSQLEQYNVPVGW